MKLIILLCVLMLISCRAELPSKPKVEIIILNEYETIVEIEKHTLSAPSVLRYGNDSNLFVYDNSIGKVFELDSNGNVVMEYGRRGVGPGEFISVNNIFLTNDYIFIIDELLLFIHKFDRNGKLFSTFDYGAIVSAGSAPPPPMSPGIQVNDINNQPFVTLTGNILLSSVKSEQNVNSIYEMINWEGNRLSNIGELPDGSTFMFNPEEYRAAINNRITPAMYRPYAFPVQDLYSEDEIFLIYSAIPIIAKYDLYGNKLWEIEIEQTSEIEAIENHYFETMEKLSRTSTMVLKKYSNGISSHDGDLFLISNTVPNDPLWIHHFNGKGELIRRYKMISEDNDLLPIVDIDSHNRLIFVVTEMSEIRAYPY